MKAKHIEYKVWFWLFGLTSGFIPCPFSNPPSSPVSFGHPSSVEAISNLAWRVSAIWLLRSCLIRLSFAWKDSIFKSIAEIIIYFDVGNIAVFWTKKKFYILKCIEYSKLEILKAGTKFETLRALKEKHPWAPENLSLPDPPDGCEVPAVASEEDVRKGILCLHAGASSFVGSPWFSGSRIAPSIRFNRPGQRHAERRSSTVCSSNTIRFHWMRYWGKKWWLPANCCRKHNQEIVSKSGLQGQSSGLSENSWGRSSWGSQPMGDARRQLMRPVVMSGIVATERSVWK